MSDPFEQELAAVVQESSDAGAEAEASSSTAKGFVVNDHRFWKLNEEQIAAEDQKPRLPTYVEQLRQEVEQKDRQLRDYIAAYKKEVVEGLEKTKQRLERDSAARMEQLRGQIAGPMLEVLDALERSIAAAEASPTLGASLLQGVKMVQLLMVQKLQEVGLTRMQSLGQPFDPARHEAVAVTAAAAPTQDNTVVAELRTGFLLGERVLRAAQVQVAKLRQ
jgi:molecular chaperone GrpE